MMDKFMSEYREQIFSEDDAFFAEEINRLEEDKNNEDDDTEYDTKSIKNKDNFNFVLRVRTYWNEMSPNTKKNIWIYRSKFYLDYQIN